VDARHPYAGELVYTAFSGSHQDAIKKGMEAHQRSGAPVWDVPTCRSTPTTWAVPTSDHPRQLAVGKGGVAYVLKNDHQLDLPRSMQVEFAQVVQRITDERGGEVAGSDIWESFRAEYLDREVPLELDGYRIASGDEGERNRCRDPPRRQGARGGRRRNGPLDAFVKACRRRRASRRACSTITSTRSAPAPMRARRRTCRFEVGEATSWGVACINSIVTASLRAVVSAINRALALA